MFKRLSLHKGHRGTTTLSPVVPGRNLRVRGEAGRREDPWRYRAHPGSRSQERGHPCLGARSFPAAQGTLCSGSDLR